jgi:hypothetical protein
MRVNLGQQLRWDGALHLPNLNLYLGIQQEYVLQLLRQRALFQL